MDCLLSTSKMTISLFRKFAPTVGAIKCRHCGSDQVRISRALEDRSILSVYRCRACGRHFKQGINLRTIAPYFFALVGVLIVLLILVAMFYFGTEDYGESGLQVFTKHRSRG